MIPTCHDFAARARAAITDPQVRRVAALLERNFQNRRAEAVARLPEFDALRDRGQAIKDHVLAHLDVYLEQFEAQVLESGGQVHWCADAGEARATVLELCQRYGAHRIGKSKSMVSEEIGLNAHLAAHGVVPVETDLGEYIIQLRQEPPSHIIAPAAHLSRQEVAETFRREHADRPIDRDLDSVAALVDEARAMLRQTFLDAEIGLTGANFLVADTGSVVLVTNEGNADLGRALPRVHIVLTTLEKLVPTMADAFTLIRLLARSATGQEMAVYTTIATGSRRPDDGEGPEHFHVVLLDNGRSALLGTPLHAALRCIRCAACLNHCPVYGAVGGHAYGWVYPGPIGAVLSPALLGLEEAAPLAHASTLCGRCQDVCPTRIPLPAQLRYWREQSAALPPRHRGDRQRRWRLKLWRWLALRPELYHFLAACAAGLLGLLGRRKGFVRRLPLAGAWTRGRVLPASQGKTFQQLWQERRG